LTKSWIFVLQASVFTCRCHCSDFLAFLYLSNYFVLILKETAGVILSGIKVAINEK